MVLTNIANFVFGPEIIILVIVIGVLIFGVKKIPELAKTFGKAKGEFENEFSKIMDELILIAEN